MPEKTLAPHPDRFKFDDPFFGNPEIAEDCYVGSSVIMIGHVIVQSDVIIWPLASIRADEGTNFFIGKGTNIQDHCCMHGHKEQFVIGDDGQQYSIYIGNHCAFAHGSKGHGPLYVGKKTFVGFNAILHKSKIGRNCFIDHNAVIKGATIGNNCHIGLNAVVTGVNIGDRRHVRDGQVINCQKHAETLPFVPKDIADEDNATNQRIVDENKHLCSVYHHRRLEIMRQKK